MIRILFLFWATCLFASTPKVPLRVQKILEGALLVDGHNDLPWTLRANNDLALTKFDLLQSQPKFHTDIPRLKKSGLNAQFWSAYVPVETVQEGTAVKFTLEQVDLIHRMIQKYSEVFEFAATADEMERIQKSGKIASMIGIEGGHSIDNSLDILRDLYAKGARYMTLTHSKNTPWADACTDVPAHNGLTAFGKEVVREMNRIGMFVDLSHVSPKTMLDAIMVSRAPVIFSHSSAWAIRHHVRNVPDSILHLMPKNGGVVMVNFYQNFSCPESQPCTVKVIADHIDHIAKVAGIDHVGLGSDFDGVDKLPEGLEDVSKYPNLVQELLNRGYDDTSIRKVLGENLKRAFKQMESLRSRVSS